MPYKKQAHDGRIAIKEADNWKPLHPLSDTRLRDAEDSRNTVSVPNNMATVTLIVWNLGSSMKEVSVRLLGPARFRT
jgi:hypothetical protein